ncbi:MAG: tetraacyldisaccharide 4'-kinase, partial [Steroidobacter sp.]
DGLQHYRLHRDFEIAVVDGSRLLGNGFLLPAGPLRELPERLQSVDLVFINQRDVQSANHDDHLPVLNNKARYRVKLTQLRSIKSNMLWEIASFHGQEVHVVTGIGNPSAFLEALQEQGIKVIPRILPDHAGITQQDIYFADTLPVFMTAKDAVKCGKLDIDERYWIVDAQAVFDEDVASLVIDRLQTIIRHPGG